MCLMEEKTWTTSNVVVLNGAEQVRVDGTSASVTPYAAGFGGVAPWSERSAGEGLLV